MVAIALLVLFVIAAGGSFVYLRATAPSAVARDKETLCPVNGAQAVTVLLIDATDDLPPAALRDILTRLRDIAMQVPANGRLVLQSMTIDGGGQNSVRRVTHFDGCNPGDGADLNDLTGNRELARRRWIARFEAPLDNALRKALQPQSSNISPIMRSVQEVSLEFFAGRRVADIPKHLVVISDFIEHGPLYSQYRGTLDFDRFIGTDHFRATMTNLENASVTLALVARRGVPNDRQIALVQFWHRWVSEMKGKIREVVRIQGLG